MAGDLEVKGAVRGAHGPCIQGQTRKPWRSGPGRSRPCQGHRGRAERLREYLAHCLESAGIEKIEGPGVRISWRKSSAVVIDDEAQIPLVSDGLPASACATPGQGVDCQWIKAGRDVPGAHVEARRTLQVK